MAVIGCPFLYLIYFSEYFCSLITKKELSLKKNAMNYQELIESKIKDIEKKLRENEMVSRWAVGPYRFELRQRLSDDENALEELEKLIEYANESI